MQLGKTTLKNSYMKKQKKDLIFYCCLIALPLIHFLVFYVYVNFNSLMLVFRSYDSTGNTFVWVGLENFKSVFANMKELTVFKIAFQNSFLVFLVGTSVSMTLGLLFSYYIYKKAPMKGLFKILLFMPSIIPAIAMATMFKQFTDSAIPLAINKILGIQMQGFLQNPDSTLGTIIFYNIWIGFGVSVLLYLGAMNNISESVVEAAKLDGVTFFKEFFFITIPLCFTTISTFIIVAIGGIFINQANIVSFFGTNPEEGIYTVGFYLYRETIKSSLASSNANFPFLATFGVLLTIITLPVVYVVNFLLKKFGPTT